MSLEEKDNIYVLEEESNDIDDSPVNFAAYKDEEREDLQDNDQRENISCFGILFRIMFNPVEGWKSLRRSKVSVENLQSGCFYPLLAFLAVSNFASFFYSIDISLAQVVSKAIVAFVAFFFGYFCIQMILTWLLPDEVVKLFDNKYGKEFIIIGLSTLALFFSLTEILPMLWPILIFLPIWTIYILFKGIRFFKFPQNQEMKFFILVSTAVIGVPLIIDWALDSLLPY